MSISSLGGKMVITSDNGVFGPSLPCESDAHQPPKTRANGSGGRAIKVLHISLIKWLEKTKDYMKANPTAVPNADEHFMRG